MHPGGGRAGGGGARGDAAAVPRRRALGRPRDARPRRSGASCGSYGHEPAARASMRRLRMGAPFLMAPFVRGMYTG